MDAKNTKAFVSNMGVPICSGIQTVLSSNGFRESLKNQRLREMTILFSLFHFYFPENLYCRKTNIPSVDSCALDRVPRARAQVLYLGYI